MGLLCYPFSLDWETFSGAKVNKKVFYAKKIPHPEKSRSGIFFANSRYCMAMASISTTAPFGNAAT